jgi:mono/diheme cytochrome c family protein
MQAFRLPRFWVALVLLALTQAVPAVGEENTIERGEYLVRAGGCFSCHTVPGGEKLAGGRALATPFWDLLHPEHHARSGNRYRPLD